MKLTSIPGTIRIELCSPNGAMRWRQQYPAPYQMNPAAAAHGEGPKATPLYANGRLYTLGIRSREKVDQA